ncbi:alpha-amylase family protein [Palleronia caenipelagi]|uniref:Alpha-amylase n=1 Tax=Palleronia caenipelagi TaxID=2489174 RepID=A0A547PR65_9RHOB|nr:alpha-amylase family protein [Palleronia caenipelagi]TRD16635.1 alpha-amylase [Palleronia caenipelagi]
MTQTPASHLSDDDLFELRWTRAARDLLTPLYRLYGDAMAPEELEARIRELLTQKWAERPADLKTLDMKRDLIPDWFLAQEMAGYVFYVDKFAGSMKGVAERIPYLQSLGITYAHFMPCLMPRPGDSDGGYAVMDYGQIDPRLGTMAEFSETARQMRATEISPCIDMVLNHTAREHEWAEAARAGDAFYQGFYHLFDDEMVPLQYERTLLEVFPNQAPGNFTFDPEMGKWVWTTFNTFQWDLNWANPEVFLAVMGIILDLANAGAEVLRLDAVAFMWKRMGTVCQNEPEVHDILQAINQAASIAAPATIFKAEAIVGPHQLVPYLGEGRHAGKVSNLAYHNSLMVQYWSALATGRSDLMTHTLKTHFPQSFLGAEWGTYLRCHDDIGWAITDDDARAVGVTGDGHRRFLAEFYAGRFPGSFARGADFQVNEATGDARTNGSLASLTGLELALESGDPEAISVAQRRILMGHALIAGFGGIPLIYMGDEIGLLNDHSYAEDPDLAGDGRWMHRPPMDWEIAGCAPLAQTHHGEIWRGVQHILATRARVPALRGDVPTDILDAGHDRLFCIRRNGYTDEVIGIFNVTAHRQEIAASALGLNAADLPRDLLTDEPPTRAEDRIVLPPYGALWLHLAH